MPDVLTAPALRAPDPPTAGLSAEQHQAIQSARWEGRKIFRAAGVATFSGWTIVTFGVVTLLSGIFGLPAFLLGVVMLVVARVELNGARKLRRLDAAAPRQLALNQLGFGAALVAYGAWNVFATLTGPGPYDEQLAGGGEVAEMIQPIANLHAAITVGFYATVAVAALVGTGLAALYYITRAGHVRAHLERTPPWVVEAIRSFG